MADDYIVVWNGSRNHPGGRQLAVEEEAVYAARQRPYRTLKDLDYETRAEVVRDATLLGVDATVQRHHVSPAAIQALLRFASI